MGAAAEPPREWGVPPPAGAAATTVQPTAWSSSPAAAESPRLLVPGHDADRAPSPRPPAATQGAAPGVSEVVLLRQVHEHRIQVSLPSQAQVTQATRRGCVRNRAGLRICWRLR